MANSSTTYIGNGSTTAFAIVFPYISSSHVQVRINDVLQTTPSQYTIPTQGTVTFTIPPAQDAVVKISRSSSIDTRLVDYVNGSVLTEAELDLDSTQAFYLAQEIQENYSDLINESLVALATANGLVVSEPEDVIDQLVQNMLDSAAASTLQASITDIANNTSGIANLDNLYGVTLNVNGYITGFAQNNNGQTGSFQILADEFYIVDPDNDGQNPIIPFAVVGGVVQMQNVQVSGGLVAGTLTGNTIQTSAADQRIVLNGGSNEAEFYGDRGDTTIERLATLGIVPDLLDFVVLDIGTTSTLSGGNTPKAINARSRHLTAIEALSFDSSGVFARSINAEAIRASGSTYGVFANASNSGSAFYAAVNPFDPDGNGLRISILNVSGFTDAYHMVLEPHPRLTGAPSASTGEDGSLIVSGNGHLYFKRSGAWSQLS